MSDALANFVIDAFKALEASTNEPGGEAVSPSESEQAGATIGRYRLLERLGEGGFGTVWKAEQTQPVRRLVALKIVKLGMDTREVVARFEAERQALALLDHPSIAKVFDAGATPTGRPYFVMELVHGEPITRHCAREKLSLRERLELFIEVCRAVQHAHQKGIIHRDLKPSNLLVSLVDGKSAPKVIDFGIAKATGGERLTEQSFVTRADRLIGTPAYMSPEQAQPGLGLDTRTDIYSLGVALYELLTGEVPYKPGPDGRLQRDHTAQRPSTRLRSLTAEELARVAETRRLEGPKLIGQVKGDLDWIVMKAIEEDPARRYESATALAEDLRRFLSREPVSARPPTTSCPLRRRNA
jgi:serine/threonine protein kinase